MRHFRYYRGKNEATKPIEARPRRNRSHGAFAILDGLRDA